MTTAIANEMSRMFERNTARPSLDERPFQSAPKGLSSQKEILVPILFSDDESKTRETIGYACSLADKFRMKIIILNLIPNVHLSDDYLEYARIEGVKDFYSSYVNSLSESLYSKWKNMLEADGILDFETITYIGSMKKAIATVVSLRNVGVVVIKQKSHESNLLQRALGIWSNLSFTKPSWNTLALLVP